MNGYYYLCNGPRRNIIFTFIEINSNALIVKVVFTLSKKKEMNSHTVSRPKGSLRVFSSTSCFIYASALDHPVQHTEGRMWLRLALEILTFQHSKAWRNGGRVSNHLSH